MEITTRYIGTTIIELTAKTREATITTDICSLSGIANEELISNRRDIADELEAHNEQLKLRGA